MAVIIGLVLVLMWRVYLHHGNAGSAEEPTIVRLVAAEFASRAA
jgi:hypothetical protein